jgi:tetratricopeptide (TPR) repeat protein
MAKIRIQCSECGHEARVPEQFRNKKVRCLRCHSKLRVPEDAPYAEPKRDQPKAPRRPRERAAARAPSRGRGEAQARRGGPSSKTRREAMTVLRELLHDYDHAIEMVSRGFEIDLRGVAFGLARTLVEEMLECRAIRDVKLAGGTGHCRLVVSLEGHEWDPEDSFADDDDDTEVFQRGGAPSRRGNSAQGMLRDAVGLDDPPTDPARVLDDDIPFGVEGAESTMQSVFAGENSGKSGMDPLALYERGLELLDEGEPREAAKLLEKAVRADKNFSRAVNALGKAYASSGDYNRARRAFRHLTKLQTDDPEAHVLHAAAAVRCERLDDAKVALRTAIKLDPEFTQAYRYAAQLYEKLGEGDKARKFRARYQALKLRG